MRHVPCPTIARLALLPTVAALLLSGCGGGGGGGDSASAAAPSPAPTPIAAPAPTGNSTALKDNTPSASANFSNLADGYRVCPVLNK